MQSAEDWSLIMTGFQGDSRLFQEAIPALFGREGLDVRTLLLSRDTFPSEIEAGLSHRCAVDIAERLEPLGVKITPVLTREVHDVRHRADEMWAARILEGQHFTEVFGMILASHALIAHRNLATMRWNPQSENWKFERSLNHRHVDAGMSMNPRERMRAEIVYARKYARLVQTAYPDREFVFAHILGDSVSFYQRSPNSPVEDILHRSIAGEKIWCVECHRQQPCRERTEPDPEFPKAIWGDCLVCGQEVWITSWEVLSSVGAT
jgi:hypothetical protein